jgi:hypothetical protein
VTGIDGLSWRKSSYSGGAQNECVEVAPTEETAAVRDTKHRAQGHIFVSTMSWTSFLSDVKQG